jgi:hypothetical protein
MGAAKRAPTTWLGRSVDRGGAPLLPLRSGPAVLDVGRTELDVARRLDAKGLRQRPGRRAGSKDAHDSGRSARRVRLGSPLGFERHELRATQARVAGDLEHAEVSRVGVGDASRPQCPGGGSLLSAAAKGAGGASLVGLSSHQSASRPLARYRGDRPDRGRDASPTPARRQPTETPSLEIGIAASAHQTVFTRDHGPPDVRAPKRLHSRSRSARTR